MVADIETNEEGDTKLLLTNAREFPCLATQGSTFERLLQLESSLEIRSYSKYLIIGI